MMRALKKLPAANGSRQIVCCYQGECHQVREEQPLLPIGSPARRSRHSKNNRHCDCFPAAEEDQSAIASHIRQKKSNEARRSWIRGPGNAHQGSLCMVEELPVSSVADSEDQVADRKASCSDVIYGNRSEAFLGRCLALQK
eukprot:TRINITY_DN38419_c0_g1_i3.p1 TRINITY_DN38419_c0_g1~~TRINITY_DN38419_c0_g1_i3.p1  ORF type:complete len:141 (-),score=16.96 TRINITY_DN38419_c0_g1_i3:63-485(-)